MLGPDDAARVRALRQATADGLTARFGRGPWSKVATEPGVRRTLTQGRVFAGVIGDRLIAALTLSARKPWAIDATFFARSRAPIYLTDMVVHPDHQRAGVGRTMLDAALAAVRVWPGDAIRLDAYDAVAGAGGFYRKCGYAEVGRKTYRGTPLIYFQLLL